MLEIIDKTREENNEQILDINKINEYLINLKESKESKNMPLRVDDYETIKKEKILLIEEINRLNNIINTLKNDILDIEEKNNKNLNKLKNIKKENDKIINSLKLENKAILEELSITNKNQEFLINDIKK